MRHRPALGSIVLLAALGGCQESPSFRLRWKLIDRAPTDHDETAEEKAEREQGFEVKRAIDCSALGINSVRVTTIDGQGQIADQRYFPCYLPRFGARDEATVGGPHLDDGPYAVEVRGVQRDGGEWIASTLAVEGDEDLRCDPRESEPVCRPEDIACDCHDLDLPDPTDEWPHTFKLAAPAECIDGVDNDRDGLVDGQEGGCKLNPDGPESDNIGAVQFRTVVTFFGGNPQVTCTSVGLGTLSARICSPDAELPCSEPIASSPCVTGEPLFFDTELRPGEYVLEISGQGLDSQTGAARSAPFTVDSSGIGASFVFETDFAVSDFEPPIEKPAVFTLQLATDASMTATRACEPGGSGTLAIATMALEVRDGHGGALAEPVFGEFGQYAPLDGSPQTCYQGVIATDPLVWGGYTLRAEALAADGTVCFTTDGQHGRPDAPITLIPGEQDIVIPRVLDQDGAPPPSCVDCTSGNECDSGVCQAGICR